MNIRSNKTKIHLDEPKADEILIQIVASGICHTDMVAQD
ncbi:Zn-dependent alcohol dehydrogenase [Cytobacillus purgationiresistens]|uniref:Zn-dependent alcohol dehydrogenase n=1 Tax=Cytobacillus purgationiresistens TaxID=863449 RepID=A0ABU0AM79_9BACI|nr:Zn-dependent alcohol dehydrogenase [Cytobacillus purgationiresistens]